MKTTLIGIAGGTGSGKTTVAEKVYNATKQFGSVTVIKMDDYYKCLDDMPFSERVKQNFDHPDAIDTELLMKHLKMLKKGEAIDRPTYDFSFHTRSSIVEHIEPCNVVILEGIMTFAIPQLRSMFDIKIFVDTPDDIRFIRRLQRDIEERGRTYASVINQYIETVRPMHLTFVEPSKRYADIIVPSSGNNDIAVDMIITKIVDIMSKNK